MQVLRLQSSVKERIPLLKDFYKKIFEITGAPASIIDHACGLNPLTLPWMNLPPAASYKAFDIDEEQIDFLSLAFVLLRLNNAFAEPGDILIDEYDYADVVFMLKLLPCLEHQKKGCSIEIIKKQKCKYAVVSFPAGSLSGRKRGMADFYSANFRQLTKDEKWDIKEIMFDNEVVFVIKK